MIPTVELGEVAEFLRNGASIKQSDFSSGTPITRIETIADWEINPDRCGYADVTEKDYPDYLMQEGDILISHINSTRHLGKCAIYRGKPEKLIHGMNLLGFRVNKLVAYPDYICLVLSSPDFRRQIPRITKDSVNQSSFTVTNFKTLKIPLPPLDEQKRIAAILDKADAIRRKRQQAIHLTDQLLRSVFLDMFGDPVTNPKGWDKSVIGEFVNVKGGFAFKSADYIDDGIRLVKISNVHAETLIWKESDCVPIEYLDKYSEFSLNDGDIVIALTRPIIASQNHVKVAAVSKQDLPVLLNQRVAKLEMKSDSLLKEYFEQFIYGDDFRNAVDKLCSVALQPNISTKQIEGIDILIPPLDLQLKFKEITDRVKKMRTTKRASLEAADVLFQSLTQSAFRGDLSKQIEAA